MQSLTSLLRRLSYHALLIAFGLLGAGPLGAQSNNAEVADLREQLAILQSRLDALEKQPLPAMPTSSVDVIVDNRGLVVEADDPSFTFRVRPRIQVDGLWFPNGADGASGFTLRRVRPAFEGEAGPLFWRFMPELAGTVRILDAWGTVTLNDVLAIQAGKFKGPIGHERLQSFSKTLFSERGLPSLLSATRETGMQLNGYSRRGIVEWNLGIYNGVFDDSDQSNNANLSGGDLDVGAQVAFQPFTGSPENLLAGVRFGFAASVGRERATIQDSDRDRRIRYQTSGRNTFFRYSDGVIADGDRVRLNVFLSCYHGPFELLTEYIQSSYDLSRGDLSRTVSTDAMTIQVGWVLTGENASVFKSISNRFIP